MTLYSVFTSQKDKDPLPKVVADRFSWFAALLPPVHFIVHGLWIALGFYIGGLGVVAACAMAFGPAAAIWLYLLLAAWIGFSVSELKAAALLDNGYEKMGDVVAPSQDVAQLEALRMEQSQ